MERGGTIQGADIVISAQPNRADRRSMFGVVRASEGIGLGVENQVDLALAVERYIFRAVPPRTLESYGCQRGTELSFRFAVDCKFEKRYALEHGRSRWVEQLHAVPCPCPCTWSCAGVRCRAFEPLVNLSLQEQQ